MHLLNLCLSKLQTAEQSNVSSYRQKINSLISHLFKFYKAVINTVQMQKTKRQSDKSLTKYGKIDPSNTMNKIPHVLRLEKNPITSPTNSLTKQTSSIRGSVSKNKNSWSQSTFKLYVGKQAKMRQKSKQSNQENSHPNITAIQKPKPIEKKGKTIKEVKMGVYKQAQSKKTPINQTQTKRENQSKQKNIVAIGDKNKQQEKREIKYIPKSIIEDFKKLTIEDLMIIKCVQQDQISKDFLAVHKKIGLIITLKQIRKDLIHEKQITDSLAQSLKIHFSLHHITANIQKIYAIFQDPTYFYIALQPVFNTHQTKNIEDQLISNMNKIIMTVDSIHKQNIILRNLSIGSLKSTMGVIKITNIIRATSLSMKKRRISFFGKISQSPQQLILGQQYDTSYDMWGIGVILYQLFLKFHPFQGGQAFQNIEKLQYQLPITLPNNLAFLINSLLCQKQKRWNTSQCLQCDYFKFQKITNNLVNKDIFNFWLSQ